MLSGPTRAAALTGESGDVSESPGVFTHVQGDNCVGVCSALMGLAQIQSSKDPSHFVSL